jgi:transcriptional regulator with XRE-family HTH domain
MDSWKAQSMTFGRWLKDELEARRLSMSELARRIGTNPGTVSRWVSDERKPDYKSCEAIALVLTVEPEMVFRKAGYTRSMESRRQALEAESERLRSRLDAIQDQFRDLQREQEDLNIRLEEIVEELQHLEESPYGNPVEAALLAIDRLPLPEDARDRLRNYVLDEVERTDRGRPGGK